MSTIPKSSMPPELTDYSSECTPPGWSDIHCQIWPSNSIPDPWGFTPCTAKLFARIIYDYWHDCQIRSEISSAAALDILDLAPGNGKSCWLLIQALQRQIGIEFQWNYYSVAPESSWFTPLNTMPELSALTDQGMLKHMIWSLNDDHPSILTGGDSLPWVASNPVIVIGHDRYSYLEQRLLAVHYGKLMELDYVIASNDEKPTENQLKESLPRWKIFDSPYVTNEFQTVLNHYLKKFNSSPIPFPEGALRAIDAINSVASFGYLLLNFAKGYATEQSLRLGLFSRLFDEFKTHKTLPVNFHLTGHRLKELGCSVEESQAQLNEVLQIAHGRHTESEIRLKRISALSAAYPIEHIPSLIEATRALGSAHVLSVRLSLLRLSEFDPDVFLTGDKALTAALSKASQDGSLDKASWREALYRVWMNYLPYASAEKLHHRLAPAAMQCGAWGLAKTILKRGMESFGESASDLANLAWCENRTGNADLGLELANLALQIDGTNPLVIEVHKRILERISLRDEKWKCVLKDHDANFILEPLDKTHAEAFFYQYRDPQIAIMTGLPALKSVEETRRWIDEQDHEKGKVNFAIMLPDEGFAGFINLAVSEHAAFFCFWSGVDFQGRGLATMAGLLTCSYAEKMGVPIMLTSAFLDNQRSIRSLKKMGFRELPIRALAPDNDRVFFLLSNISSFDEKKGSKELVDYYEREKLSLKFPALENFDPEHAVANSVEESS
ncbi:MAG: GNAT family N-acetyltransferase [Oxalobacteraceae bacterium]|nr:GNAT family N-acetyltransferase [Oxalobacteraceae bacterium]